MSEDVGSGVAVRRVLREAPSLRRGLMITVLLAGIGTAIQLVVPVVVQQIVDFELLDPSGVDVVGAAVRGAIALAAVALASFVRGAAFVRLAVRSAAGLSELRVKTFRHLHRLSVLHVEAERRGTLVSRVTSDIQAVQEFMEWGGVGLLVGSAQVVLTLVAMLVYEWRLALIVTVGAVGYAALLLWFQRILRRAHDHVRTTVGESLAVMGESISGLQTVRAFGAEDETMGRLDDVLTNQFEAEFGAMKLGATLYSSAELFAGFLTATVIGAGIFLGADGGISAGTLLAFLFLVNLLVDPIQVLVETLDEAQSAAAGIRRVLTVLDRPIDIDDPAETGTHLPPGSLSVEFAHVTFRYPTGGDVLHDVSLRIEPGSRIAIVGETGSGKSTFTKIVTRLLDPSDGEVRLGAVPIDAVPLADLRDRVAFVPQEGFLFDATVAENVRYGSPTADDGAIRRAFDDLELSDWLASLPQGLQTRVGERGGQLSTGERQLVALVRAWIAGPDLLVLDEATSAVDPALEVRLRRAIERLTAGRTSLTVAHRLSTAEASDDVLVFDKGRIVERGPHASLVSGGGVYAELHRDWTAGATESG